MLADAHAVIHTDSHLDAVFLFSEEVHEDRAIGH